jgi:hypothetical protein
VATQCLVRYCKQSNILSGTMKGEMLVRTQKTLVKSVCIMYGVSNDAEEVQPRLYSHDNTEKCLRGRKLLI